MYKNLGTIPAKILWPYGVKECITLAKKKDTTMSQMTSLQKALKAWLKVSVLVNTAAVTDRKAQAPVGKGSSTRPACRQVFQVWKCTSFV